MKKNSTTVLAVVVAIVLTAVVSSALTILYLMGGIRESGGPFRRYARLETIRKTVEKEYYTEVDDETLLNGAMKGMLAGLNDPYSYYSTPEETKMRSESEEQSYHGFGMTVAQDENGGLLVAVVGAGTPAESAGVLVDDRILAVNGIDITALSFEEAAKILQSEENEEALLSILRSDEMTEIRITRGKVEVSNVTAYMLEDNIGYIRIMQFAGRDVEDFRAALSGLNESGAVGLIIDVRDDPGGYLSHVTEIADALLPEALIVYTQDRSGKRIDHYSDAEYCDLPLCVLINENSASASEIFAAAVKDNGRGCLVGTKTFGKGIVQTVYTFDEDGASMQFTSSTYYTPSGNCIHGAGVLPDIPEEDAQLQLETAIRVLKERISG